MHLKIYWVRRNFAQPSPSWNIKHITGTCSRVIGAGKTEFLSPHFDPSRRVEESFGTLGDPIDLDDGCMQNLDHRHLTWRDKRVNTAKQLWKVIKCELQECCLGPWEFDAKNATKDAQYAFKLAEVDCCVASSETLKLHFELCHAYAMIPIWYSDWRNDITC